MIACGPHINKWPERQSSIRSGQIAAPSTQTMTTIHIAVIAFNDISPFHLSVPTLVFAEQCEGMEMPRFSLKVCGFETGPLSTSAGFDIQLHHGLEVLSQADVIIMPSWRNTEERPPEPLLEALRQAHGKGTRIVGLCLGA